jgi:protein SCO1/2
MWSKRQLAASLACVCVISTGKASAQALLEANIVEHIGAPIPRDLTFTDESGRAMTLGSLVGGKPLVISLAYYTCPMLCPMGQDGAAEAFRDSGWRIGPDFRAVTISIDPRDRPQVAREWRERAAAHMRMTPDAMDWHFLVGREVEIRRLADALGFRYAYDADSGQYSHAAALFIVTADGRLSRYVYGITFDAGEIGAALTTAGVDETRGSVSRFLMRCFHYVPASRRHGSFVVWLLRLGALTIIAALGSLLVGLWRREGRLSAVRGD